MPELRRLQTLDPNALRPLIAESQQEGFQFLQRLADEFATGRNRFDQSGEALFGLYDEQTLIGIGGLNLDPYRNDPRIGRVRHLYIARQWRRSGCGKLLMQAIIDEARQQFYLLTLRTDTSEAAAFYEALGFQRAALQTNDSHFLFLNSSPLQP